MAKNGIVRSNRLFVMYRRVAKKRGRGSKFQWNAKAQYAITYIGPDFQNTPTKVFKTLEEADKEWVYLMLKHS